MRQFEGNARSGKKIVVISDKFVPGRFASGFRLSRDGKMKFVGGFLTREEAETDARRRMNEAIRKN